MKKSTKTALMAAGILVVIGALLCAGAFLLAGGDWDKFMVSSEEFSRMEYTAAVDDVDCIDIDASTQQITVRRSDDGEIHLHYGQGTYSGFDIDLSHDGTLSAESYQDRNRPWYKYISFNWNYKGNADVVLELPESYDGALNLSGETSDISLEDVELSDVLNIAVLTGKIELDGVEAKAVNIASTTGKIQLGDIKCGGSVNIASTTGDIDMNNVRVDDTLSVAASTAEISFGDISAAALSFTSTTGRIEGTLPGAIDDYRITSSTTTGSDSLSGGGFGSIPLNVKTTTGDIEIDFED